MEFGDYLFKLVQFPVRPVERPHRCPVLAVADDLGAGAVEQLDEQLRGQQGQAAALGKMDFGHLPCDDRFDPLGMGGGDHVEGAGPVSHENKLALYVFVSCVFKRAICVFKRAICVFKRAICVFKRAICVF